MEPASRLGQELQKQQQRMAAVRAALQDPVGDPVERIHELKKEIETLRAKVIALLGALSKKRGKAGRFVAVVCLNDYPYCLTSVQPTTEAADAVGQARCKELREQPPKQVDIRRAFYFHYHVHSLPN